MAVVAQLVEPRVVISVVVGSSPISRPNFYSISFIHTLFISLLIALVGIFFRLNFVYESKKAQNTSFSESVVYLPYALLYPSSHV